MRIFYSWNLTKTINANENKIYLSGEISLWSSIRYGRNWEGTGIWRTFITQLQPSQIVFELGQRLHQFHSLFFARRQRSLDFSKLCHYGLSFRYVVTTARVQSGCAATQFLFNSENKNTRKESKLMVIETWMRILSICVENFIKNNSVLRAPLFVFHPNFQMPSSWN